MIQDLRNWLDMDTDYKSSRIESMSERETERQKDT